jgi:heme-degrading monooxygenase HmoA
VPVMIARVWHGTVPKQRSAEYLELMRTRALPDYRRVPGNQGAYVFVRDAGDVVHFEALSFWESMAAVAGFAGSDVTAARYYDFDADFLLELEPTVTHHEVYAD